MDKKKLGKVVAGVFAVILCGTLFICNNYQKSDVIVTEGFSDSGASENEITEEGTDKGNVNPDSGEDKGKTEQSENKVYIHICGEVKKPGVYVFDREPRTIEVVQRAGGFTKKADQTGVNLAGSVTDGMQLIIGKKGGKSADRNKKESTEHTENSVKVNINQASKEELMTLSGIGESKASQIISYRESHGAFQKTEDIMNISGIKNGVFDKIKDFITV